MNFRGFISLLLLLSFLSCNKVEIDAIRNLNGDVISVIGHGGGGFQSPLNKESENSLLSITKAIEVYNADGVEVDVQLSKDLHLVLYHDNKLETSTTGNGFVHEYKLDKLVQFKYNREFYANILINEHITALETVLEQFVKRKVKPQLHIDSRSWLYNSTIYTQAEFNSIYADKIIETITKYNYQDYTYFASGDIELLEELAEKNSQIKLLIETNEINWAVEIINKNNWYGIVAKNKGISKAQVEYAHSKNVRIALFGVKVQSGIVSAVKKHPDFIFTDNIVKLQQILYH